MLILKKILSLLLIMLPFMAISQYHSCNNPYIVCDNNPHLFEVDDAKTNSINLDTRGCLKLYEHQPIWLKINIAKGGSLCFDLSSVKTQTHNTDIDFALYRVNAYCNDLGEPIRCSFSIPFREETTGLRFGCFDHNDDVWGDGFVECLDVECGDIIYLLIDNFTEDFSKILIMWTGTAIFGCPG